MRLVILCSLILILSQSCTSVPPCEYNREYTIRLNSDIDDAYGLFVDGEYIQDIPGYTYIEIQVTEGYHEVYLEQLDGYRRYPRHEFIDITGSSCDYHDLTFPN